MSETTFLNKRVRVIFLFFSLIVALIAVATPTVVAQSPVLTITPITWNIIGLDSNSPTSGPSLFPVGVQVCNSSSSPLSPISVAFNWTSANAYINTHSGSLTNITIPSLAASACYDVYFEVEITQVAAAYHTTRSYTISATSGTATVSIPSPRELFVEHLVSQNRNSTIDVQFGTSVGSLVSVPVGGTMNLMVGQSYYIRLIAATATQGYEQIESFITLPNVVFEVLDVTTTYSADTSTNVPAPNPRLYGDACVWENDPNSPNYLSCLSTGKTGGSLVSTYHVKILSNGGGGTKNLNSLTLIARQRD